MILLIYLELKQLYFIHFKGTTILNVYIQNKIEKSTSSGKKRKILEGITLNIN